MPQLGSIRNVGSGYRTPSMTVRRVCVVCAAVAIYAGVLLMLPSERAASPTSTDSQRSDVAMYEAIVSDLQSGQSYYDADGNELRTRGYPTTPIFNWREPLLYETLARLTPRGGQILLGLLSVGLALVTFRRPFPAWTMLLVWHDLVPLIVLNMVYMTEFWAGIILGWATVAFIRQWRYVGIALSVLALAVRELAAPYCVAMTLWALWRRDWRMVRGWMLGGLAYAVYYGWHAWQATQHLLPSDAALVHPHSWISGGGVPFLLRAIRSTGLLFLLPPPIFGVFIVLAAAAWWGPMPTEIRIGVVSYTIFLLIAGQPFDAYWGLMMGPMLAMWMAYAPSGITTLLAVRSRTARARVLQH